MSGSRAEGEMKRCLLCGHTTPRDDARYCGQCGGTAFRQKRRILPKVVGFLIASIVFGAVFANLMHLDLNHPEELLKHPPEVHLPSLIAPRLRVYATQGGQITITNLDDTPVVITRVVINGREGDDSCDFPKKPEYRFVLTPAERVTYDNFCRNKDNYTVPIEAGRLVMNGLPDWLTSQVTTVHKKLPIICPGADPTAPWGCEDEYEALDATSICKGGNPPTPTPYTGFPSRTLKTGDAWDVSGTEFGLCGEDIVKVHIYTDHGNDEYSFEPSVHLGGGSLSPSWMTEPGKVYPDEDFQPLQPGSLANCDSHACD